MIRFQTIREQVGNAQEGAARAFAFSTRRPSLIGRLFSVVIFLILAAIAIIILVPLILIALAGGLVFLLYIRCRAWLTVAKQPNGPLDGRKNVRVREPGETV